MTPHALAAWFAFWTLWFHALALCVPIIAGPVRADVQPMNCPEIVITHGVGADLKTWISGRDLCAEE